MKIIKIIFCFLSLLNTPINAQNVTIPDPNFKAYLIGNAAINTNGDTEIQTSEAIAFTGTIDCSNLGITNLNGIETFVNLTVLNCESNQLMDLNVRHNTKLTELQCHFNRLWGLDVTNNTDLIKLGCAWNYITQLDVSQNTDLVHLNCNINRLSELDLYQNVNLTTLHCGANLLDSLNLSQNINIVTLDCGLNELTNLDISPNINLKRLHCQSNRLTSLDLSQHGDLESLFCSNNELTSLDLNQNRYLTSLRCELNKLAHLSIKNGHNSYLSILWTRGNPDLTCIEVDNPTHFGSLSILFIDSMTVFRTDCSLVSSTNKIDQTLNVKSYPNPTKEAVTLDLGQHYRSVAVQVENIAGQIILSEKLENVSLVTLELKGAAGIYFAHVRTDEGEQVLKIIKE